MTGGSASGPTFYCRFMHDQVNTKEKLRLPDVRVQSHCLGVRVGTILSGLEGITSSGK